MVDVAAGQIWTRTEKLSGRVKRFRVDAVEEVPGAGGSKGARGVWLDGNGAERGFSPIHDAFFASAMTEENGWELLSPRVAADAAIGLPVAVSISYTELTSILNELERLQRRETELQTRMSEMVEERQKRVAEARGQPLVGPIEKNEDARREERHARDTAWRGGLFDLREIFRRWRDRRAEMRVECLIQGGASALHVYVEKPAPPDAPAREFDDRGCWLGPTKYRATSNGLCGAGLERGLFCRRESNHKGKHQEGGGGREWPGEDEV